MFNLEQAIENWRAQLSSLPAEDRRELETHLRETIAEWRQKGLSLEEAYLIASRRTGRPQQLTEEFAKANPVRVWRERLFWMWLALFLSYTVGRALYSVGEILWAPRFVFHSSSRWLQFAELMLVCAYALAPAILIILLAKGKFISTLSKLHWLIENRRRLAVATLCCVAVSSVIRYFGTYKLYTSQHMQGAFVQSISTGLYMLIAGLILIWLLPSKEHKTAAPDA